VKNGQKVNFAVERLDVKAGVHTAAKVGLGRGGLSQGFWKFIWILF
jgi:hypothetical protein